VIKQLLAVFVSWTILISPVAAQSPTEPATSVEKPQGVFLLRPYKAAFIPDIRLSNSDRLHSLIRAGKLYLTVQDCIALVIENNLDLEIDRYGPVSSQWAFERAQAGGPLRGVTGGNSLVNQAASGQGVQGSQISAGLTSSGSGSGTGGGNAIVTQIGPVTANLDAVLQNATAWSHTTTPQPNTIQSQTTTLIDSHHTYDTFVQQGLITGGYVQVAANESYLKENTPTDILNPSVAPVVQLYLRHNLLQNFGAEVNSRFIRVARKNIGLADAAFRSQLLNAVANTLNLYWDLETQIESRDTSQRSLDLARKFVEDTKKEIELGVVARVDVYRPEGEVTTRTSEVAIAEAAVRQQENLLKNVISRNGLADPALEAASIVPLDRIQVPESDDLPPLRDLVKKAIAQRPDVAMDNINLETAEISAVGTKNGLLPSLQGIAATFNSGLAGAATPQPPGQQADPHFVGGLGTGLGQILRNNFPSRRAGVLFQGVIGNRIAQGDYGVDQLQLRQNQLVTLRNRNQLVVDIANQVVGLTQARARYNAAVDSRKLEEQLLEKEQQRFSLGGSTLNDLITVERALAAAQSTQVVAIASYNRARIALDQVLGETLEKNNISIDQALAGRAR
jgi:outer membrane protein